MSRRRTGTTRKAFCRFCVRSPKVASRGRRWVTSATEASGYLTAYTNSLTSTPDTSSLNFTAGQDIATTTVVAVDATSKIKITVGPGANLHVLVDVIGYYQ